MNRLQQELSPYLNLWAEDPVDWYPWGHEAFARAMAEHKPMLISVGTTAVRHGMPGCSEDVVRLTERYFIPVQLDGQEHPGPAAVYAQAAGLLSGWMQGPMTVIADSAGRPFFTAGALEPVELAGLLSGVALHWNSDRTPYTATAELIRDRLEALSGAVSPAGEPKQLYETHYKALQSKFDPVHGGFGTGTKAPWPARLLFLLGYARWTGDRQALGMVTHTLRQMAMGGIRDHIGGGFFRSADRLWQHPAREKRLIDQAWLLLVYAEAWADTGEEQLRTVARETADFVLRELRHAAGGFYTAQWSGAGFYDLTGPQVIGCLGDNDGAVFCRQYDVGDEPGVPDLLHGEEPQEDSLLLYDLRKKLYRYRLERRSPDRDEKVLLGWNGVMVAALARAGRLLGVERYLAAASDAEEFLRSRLANTADLRRYWCHGAAAGEGALEDYAGYSGQIVRAVSH